MSPDPYRTLGLEAGASMAEVKRAYRLLAKAFHPDSAGEVALPRFLAIHAAYEQIRTGRLATGIRSTRGPAPAAEPWRADPERARTARERARSARSARTGSAGPSGAPGAATGSTGPGAGARGGAARQGASASSRSTGSRPDATGPAGPTGSSSSTAGGAAGFGRTRGGGRRRETRKATLGSTSYDEARDATDASWSGASWYGPTTGEYWIVNPREYADPRKHGPDYQSRARRPAYDELPGEPGGEDPASATWGADDTPADPVDGRGPDRTWPSGAAPGGPRGAAAPTAGSGAGRGRWAGLSSEPAWDASAGAAGTAPSGAAGSGGAGATATRPRRRASWDAPGDAGFDPSWPPPFMSTGRDWLGGPADDPVRRLGLALVAWPPIGLAAAAAIDGITGCSIHSADCGGTEPLLPWLAQAGILGLLLLLPPIARLLAGGTVAFSSHWSR
jgi:hypothetical protein